MKVSIGSDHRGIEQRKLIAETIVELGHTVDDQGSFTDESCDYPDIAVKVADEVAGGKADRGILVCGTGIGMSMAANKVDGIRAALCCSVASAELSRQHNNANVLCLAGNSYDPDEYRKILRTWLTTDFEGGRHARRVEKVMNLESADPTD